MPPPLNASSAQVVRTSRHECSAAAAGIIQSHSTIAGFAGLSSGIVMVAPIGVQSGPDGVPRNGLPELQKSPGSAGSPPLAAAKKARTCPLALLLVPRFCDRA